MRLNSGIPWLFVLATFILPAALNAEPLAQRIPDDAILYVGWAGADTLGQEYKDTHTQALLNESQIPQLFTDFFPRLMDRFSKDDPQKAQQVQIVGTILGQMWKHPSAFYFGGVDFPNDGGQPQPRAAFLCDAGADAQDLLDKLNAALARAAHQPDKPAMEALKDGELVILKIGQIPDSDAAVWREKPAETGALANAKEFTETMRQVELGRKTSVAVAYFDAQRFVGMVDELVQANPNNQNNGWLKGKEILGLTGLTRAAWTGGFVGRNWSSEKFIGTSGPRSGLLTLLDSRPLDDALLKMIPQTASSFGAGNLNLDHIFTEARNVASQADPAGGDRFDMGAQALDAYLGFHLDKDLLASLGDQWAWYSSPEIGGNGLLGTVLINKLSDSARAEKALSSLEDVVENLLEERTEDQKLKPSFKQTKYRNITIHYLAIPVASPAWAVHDGTLYVALYPQMVAAAMDRADAKGPSILENVQFNSARKDFSTPHPAGINYVDLPQTAPDGYQVALATTRLYLGLADMAGAASPGMVLPPLSKLQPHLAPAYSVSWTDDAGWHSSGVSPFPGANLLGGSSTLLGSNSALLAFIRPIIRNVEARKQKQKTGNAPGQ